VLRAEGCSRSTLYARIQRGEVPPPIPNPGGKSPNLWRKSEMVKRQQERFAQTDVKAKFRAVQAA
jgi:predicted DNA-binding transcriptional regulator AlpA